MNLAQKFRQLLGEEAVAADEPTRIAHSGDKWFATHQPDVVVFAQTTEQVSRLLRFASENKIPVTARGAGFGYVGGCVPVQGGIALSLARMNRIKEINFDDAIAIVEPGVITGELQARRPRSETLLSARSRESARLQHRRKCRDERGRPALFEVWCHSALRHRPRGRARER